ncbi:hypothetical protein SVA_3600 [Sulfurifustis variabilis]|uniref:Uncharacterized protein n=1 Tax=Sulfurifustis variabilis TaxID=1675686 RepID=A0A1C7AFL1_9GAMM|nr:hypothetical protein SVA_3600 [Sulfurifustis variabilis]
MRSHDFLCNSHGVQMIRDDIEKEGVNHVVIAACSRCAKTDAFGFDGIALSRAASIGSEQKARASGLSAFRGPPFLLRVRPLAAPRAPRPEWLRVRLPQLRQRDRRTAS